MSIAVLLERPNTIYETQVPIIVPVVSETPRTDLLLQDWEGRSYEGWDEGSRAIVAAWNLEDGEHIRGATAGEKALTEPYTIELQSRVEKSAARGETELARVWALRDRGINDPESLNLKEYTKAYWQLSDEAYAELRAERPRWQQAIGWRRGKDKRLAAKAAEYLLLGDEADNLLKPDVSVIPRSKRRERAEVFIQRTGWFKPIARVQYALANLPAEMSKWMEHASWRRKVTAAALGVAAVGALASGLTADLMESLPSEEQFADIAASLVGLDDVQPKR